MDDADARRALAALVGLEVDPADPADVFELQHAEGAGASGRVFRACRRSDASVVVALKVIPIPPLPSESDPSSASSPPPPAAVVAVAREIAFLRACDHPNVVAFRGAYYKSGALWLAMEHCAGGSAASVRARGPLSERQIGVVLCGALRGLAYLHARRKLHRDVKGANILLTRSGRIKLADFGVSAQLPGSIMMSEEENKGETPPPFQRGTFVGTPYWMSPEMIQDGAYDHKADVWSLGVTAIELADREPPLFREHPMRALLQIPRNAPPTVREPSKWSDDFIDFLAFVLRKNPRERPTAAECLRHAFLRRVEHVDSVFEDEDAPVEATGEAPTVVEGGEEPSQGGGNQLGPAVEGLPLDAAESRVEGEVADAMERLDTKDVGEELDATHESVFDSPVTVDASISSLTSCSSARERGEDELLDLSVDEGTEIVVRTPQPTASITVGSPPKVETLAPTPARAESPVRRSHQRPRSAFSPTVCDTVQASSGLSELSVELGKPLDAPTGDSDAGESGEWASSSNPLAQIAASTASERVSALLASLSSSHASALLAHSATESAVNTTGSVVHSSVHDTPPPPAALLLRSSFSLSLTSSFREALTNSRADSINTAVETPPPSLVTPWRELRPRQFGVPLDDQHTTSRTGGRDALVPALLHLLRRELLLRDTLRTTRWVYRASPDARELERARTAIDHGTGFDPDAVGDANVFASLLKLWLRELPAPLLSPVRSSDVKRLTKLATALPDDEDDPGRAPTRLPLAEVHEQVQKALGDVRGRRRAVLEWLLDHWLEVLAYTASNRMTAHGLAVVFAPSVYPCGYGLDVGAGSDSSGSAVVVGDVVAMLRVLIHWRRSCRDTGFVQVVDRLESVAPIDRDASIHQGNGEREVRPVATTQDATALVWPAGGKCSAVKLGSALGTSMDGFENRQSVETMMKECVRRVAGLSDRDSDENEAGGASESLEHERFVAFQRSVADALTAGAKTSDEIAFARRFRAAVILPNEPMASLKPSTETWEQLRREIPASVKRLERWMAAAVSIEGFQAVVRSERAVFDKRRRLRELQARGSAAFPLSDRAQCSFVARIGGDASRLRLLHNLKHRYASSQHVTGKRMMDGARWIVEMRLGYHNRVVSDTDNNASEEDAAELATLGETEPVVGILLLAALDQST